jgi:hypothetical protein
MSDEMHCLAVNDPHWLNNNLYFLVILTLILLTWRIWWAHNNASKWQMGFNSAFKGLRIFSTCVLVFCVASLVWSVWVHGSFYSFWCVVWFRFYFWSCR